LEPWRRLRDRLLTSPRFRRWALAFPLTRPVARRRVAALFDLVAGFVYTQVLTACVALDLFRKLHAGPRSSDSLAEELDLPPANMLCLLRAAAALRLLEERGGARFGLGPLGAALIDNPGVVAMIEHHRLLYHDLADPVALLRGTVAEPKLQAFWSYAGVDFPGGLAPDRVAGYSALMAASQPMISDEILSAVSLGGVDHLLDIGGGDGAFLIAASRFLPDTTRLTLFDLPPVAERARQRLEAQGLGERIATVGGDFFKDSLPSGADLVTLVRIVHDQGDPAAVALLTSVRSALAPGGRLLLAEPMADTPGAEAMGAAYFGLYLLAMGSGRPRSEADLRRLLTDAGFRRVRRLPTHTPLLTRLLLAEG